MPAFTANRGYPYSLPADPTDVPGAIQDLAEAIDFDIASIRSNFPRRPALQISSTAPQVTGGLGVNTALTFDRIDFGADFLTSDLWRGGWVNPGPGVWVVIGRVAVPRSLPSPLPTALESQLHQTPFIQAPNTEISQSTEHVFPSPSDMVYDLTVAMTAEIPNPPSDGFRLFFQALQSGGSVSAFTVGARTMTMMRMHT